MRWFCACLLFAVTFVPAGSLFAQKDAAGSQSTATCEFEDGKQMTVRYPGGITTRSVKLVMGKMWDPGSSPLVLFTQTDFTVGKSEVPAGAYFLYLIPDKDNWTLIVNKNVTPGTAYDAQQDVAKVSMDLGTLSVPQDFSVVFGRSGPKTCSMRVYFGKTGTWADFQEK